MLLTHIGNLVQSWFHHLGFVGVALAMAIESCLIPLPSEIVMPVAGSFVAMGLFGASHTVGLIGVSLAGAIGCVIGSAAAYWIGAVGGRPFIFKYGKYILISRHDFDMADRAFQKNGAAITFFSRLLPIIRTYISLPAGIARMNFGKFVLYTFLGSLPWCFVLALIGDKVGKNAADVVGKYFHGADYVIIALVVILVGLYVYRHIRNERAYDAKLAAQGQTPEADPPTRILPTTKQTADPDSTKKLPRVR
jgi:membrane protein DedA with SNARE-associated domain